MNARWKRIAIEASKQCACKVTPSIDPITSFNDVILSSKIYDLSMLACISHNTISIKKAMPSPLPRNVIVMIGPEGDFSEREVIKAKNEKIKLISLGPRILKSDTAGIFVVSVIGYEGGNQ
jgi:16S rRNA (uracil1498-N3)-methyltransferase